MSKKERLGMGWGVLVGALYVVMNGVVRTLNAICRLYEPPCDYLVGRSFVIAFSSLTLVSIIVAIIYSFQGKCKKAGCVMCYFKCLTHFIWMIFTHLNYHLYLIPSTFITLLWFLMTF